MAKLTKKEINRIHDYTTHGMTDRELRSRLKQHAKMVKNNYWEGQAWLSDYQKVQDKLGFSSRAVQSYDFLRRNALAYQQRSEFWDVGYSKLAKEQKKRNNQKLGGFK